MSHCIDDNALVEFVEGSLPAAEASQLESHVLRCLPCRRRLIAVGTSPSRLAEAPTAPAGIGAHLSLEPGTRVGRFEVKHEIGRGGMGIVFAARDPQLERHVALKLLHSASSSIDHTVQAQERMLAEARAMARLDHPNIVTVFEAGTFRHETYIAMELVEGDTLNHWLRRWNRSWPAIVDVFRQVAGALGHAHDHGIAHGDLKPENILVDDRGRTWVTDFGLARWMGEPREPDPACAPATVDAETPGAPDKPDVLAQQRRPLVMGTPRYMAPEQFAGRPADAGSDQFSFCVALYEALYGHHPFYQDTALSLLKVSREQAVAPMREDVGGNHDVPAWLHHVLVKGLDPDPRARHASMPDLLAALAPPLRRARRGHTLVAMIAASLVVCSLGYALGAWLPSPRPDRLAGDDATLATLDRNQTPAKRHGPGAAAAQAAPAISQGARAPDTASEAGAGDISSSQRSGSLAVRSQRTLLGAASGLASATHRAVTELGALLDQEIARSEEHLRVLRLVRDTVAWIRPDSPAGADDQGSEPGSKPDDSAQARTPRRNGLSVPAVLRGIDGRWRDLEVCFLEWRDRQPGERQSLEVRLRIDSRGHPEVRVLRGLADKVVRKCVTGALEAAPFPAARYSTVVDTTFRSSERSLARKARLVTRE